MAKREATAPRKGIWCYSNAVKSPPQLITGYDENGVERSEDLLVTGWFACDEEAWLQNHQIDLTYAYYHFRTSHFELCLLSLDNYRVLCDLQLKGLFETPFYLTWSLGHLYHLELLQKQGKEDGERPILPLWSYLASPNDETRQALERWREVHTPALTVVQGGRSVTNPCILP